MIKKKFFPFGVALTLSLGGTANAQTSDALVPLVIPALNLVTSGPIDAGDYTWHTSGSSGVFGWANLYAFSGISWFGTPPMIGTAHPSGAMTIRLDEPVSTFQAELNWGGSCFGCVPPKIEFRNALGNTIGFHFTPIAAPTSDHIMVRIRPINDIKEIIFSGSYIGVRNIKVGRISPIPTALAGPDRSVAEGSMVQLAGQGSDPQGESLSFQWTQVGGPSVVLSDPTLPNPTFQAPWVSANTALTFQLIVTDASGNVSKPDTVDIGVQQQNLPPVADAGDPSTVKEGVTKQLDGSKSYDPDTGDLITTYSWVQTSGPAVTLQPSANVQKPSFVAPVSLANQVLSFRLTVSDGKEVSAPSSVAVTVVPNSAPVANAGTDITVNENGAVSLNAAASQDPDNDGLKFKWLQTGGPVVTLTSPTSPAPSFTAPWVSSGGATLTFELTATDDDSLNPKSSKDVVAVNVLNANDPPNCSLAKPSVDLLWPPNHAMLPISITGISDPDATSFSLRINSVTQDEPTNGLGDGDVAPDAVIQSQGTTDTVLLRAERSGTGNGRVYKVNFTASDPEGYCTGSVKVTVPHDRKGTALDNGQNFNSLSQ